MVELDKKLASYADTMEPGRSSVAAEFLGRHSVLS